MNPIYLQDFFWLLNVLHRKAEGVFFWPVAFGIELMISPMLSFDSKQIFHPSSIVAAVIDLARSRKRRGQRSHVV